MSTKRQQKPGLLRRWAPHAGDAAEISDCGRGSDSAASARGRRTIAALAAVSTIAVLPAAGVAPASAQPRFAVNATTAARDRNLADGMCISTNNSCTLRSAMWEASLTNGTVVLPPGVFRLTIPPGGEATGGSDPFAGDLDVCCASDIRVIGAGVDNTRIDGMNTNRIFDVGVHGTLSLTDVTLQDGKADFDGDTGHSHGGAIHNHGTLYLERVAVTNSTSTSTSRTWGGGGITNAPGAVAQLLNVTIAGNSTDAQGGGIENKGTLRMLYVTITNNSAPGPSCIGTHPPVRGRGTRAPPPPCQATHGGGIFFATGSTTSVADTIVAKNPSGRDCTGPGSVTSRGGNLQGDGRCPFNGATDRNGDPRFDFAHLGPPLFYPLLATSPALDVPTTVLCIPGVLSDIRGVDRPQDGKATTTVSRCATAAPTSVPRARCRSATHASRRAGAPARRRFASPFRCRLHPRTPSRSALPPATVRPAPTSTTWPRASHSSSSPTTATTHSRSR